MTLKKLDEDFSICKLQDTHNIDFNQDFMFFSKTDEEVSLVCPSGIVPSNAVTVESGWKAFRIDGVLDLNMVGVAASITGILAKAEISVFIISTYNTDYFFVKAADFSKSVSLLENSDYEIN
jgi:hypothetical protein